MIDRIVKIKINYKNREVNGNDVLYFRSENAEVAKEIMTTANEQWKMLDEYDHGKYGYDVLSYVKSALYEANIPFTQCETDFIELED